MAEPIKSPIASGITAVRNTVSSNVFSGVGNTEIDPVFTKWVKTRSDGADDNVRAQNANTLTNIDVQLKNISNQNSVLTSALQVIASNLNVATELDKRREVAKAKRERQAAEAGLRSGKEQQIESKIQMALMAPIKRVGAKLKFGLNRLTSFFAILLGGWLIDKTVSFLRALSEGNQDKVKEIRVTILKGLLLAGGALFLLKAGLAKITFTLGSLAGIVATFGFRNLVARPFQAIVGFLAKQRLLSNFKGVQVPGPGSGTGSTQVTPPKTGNTKTDTKGNNKTNRGPNPNLPKTRFQQGIWTKPGTLALILSAYYGLQNVAQGKDIQTEVLDQTAGFGVAGFTPWITSALGLSGPKGWMANFVIGSLLWNAGYRGRSPATQKVMEAYKWLTTPGNEDKTINDLPADLQEAIKQELGPGGQLEQLGKDLESGDIMPSAMSDIDPSELIKEKDKNTEKLLSNMMGRGAAKKRMEAAERKKNEEIEAKKINDQNIIASKNKSETKNLIDNLSNLDEVQPTIIPLPIGDNEQSQDGSNVAAGAQGGSVPNISSSNVANSYVYLALKHYQVAPV